MKYVFVLWAIVILYTIFAWVSNLIGFFGLDFNPIGYEEVVKGIGLFLPPVSWFSCWI